MATVEDLRPGQQGVLSLLLRRGQSYDELAETLHTSVPVVKGMARDAVRALAPPSEELDAESLDRLADYTLGQLPEPEAAGVRTELERSLTARGWTSDAVASLAPLYERVPRPPIPTPVGAGSGRAPARSERPSGKRSRRVGYVVIAAVAIACAVVAATVFSTREPASDEPARGRSAGAPPAAGTAPEAPRIERQALLRPTPGEDGLGIAAISRRGASHQLVVQARLPQTRPGERYELWLYRSRGDARSLGARATGARGAYRAAVTLPAGFEAYDSIDLSRESGGERAHSGDSVLRAPIRPEA